MRGTGIIGKNDNMKTSASASRCINFLVARQKASEGTPVKFGNVEFWNEIPGLPVALCYSLPINQWDVAAVQSDLNKAAETCWDELCAFLGTPATEGVTP